VFDTALKKKISPKIEKENPFNFLPKEKQKIITRA